MNKLFLFLYFQVNIHATLVLIQVLGGLSH